MLRKIGIIMLVGVLSLFCFSTPPLWAQNIITNGDFSVGIQGWTVVPTDPAPWPLVDGAVNLHPPSGSYLGTVIYQNLNVTGVGGKKYDFSMKLLKTGIPDDSWRTIAVYLTYLDGVTPVRYKLANPLNSEIATPLSVEAIPTFSGTVGASVTLPTTATAITKIEIAKENFGDFTVDDIVLAEGAAACTFTVAKFGSPNPSVYLGAAGGTATLNVTASNSACTWSASVASGSDWLSIASGASGTGSGQMQISAAANPSTNGIPRDASVSFGAGQGFNVWQMATALPRTSVALGSLQSRRAGNHTATLLQNGKVLIVGGHTNVNITDVLATAELYDPASRTFTLTGSMNVPRWGHTATLLPDGKVLIAGGYNYTSGSHTNLDSAELYDPATGQFTLLASKMSSPRRQHTATPFTDPTTKAPKILIAGGINSGGAAQSDTWSVTNKADLYDVATSTFAPTGNLVAGRGTHRATTIPGASMTVNSPLGGTITVTGTNILVVGGSNFDSYLASAEIYDTVAGTFSATGSMTTGRAHGIGNFGPVFGGGLTTGQTCLASTEIYNTVTKTFSSYATLSQARRGHEVTPLSPGRILVSGGDCAGNATMEILDLATDAFTPSSQSMTAARVFHTATYLPNAAALAELDILLVGGDPGGTAELYTTSTAAGTNATLNVQLAGTGSGLASAIGLICGDAGCSGSYPIGTSVTLTASSASGSIFAGWSGGGCSGTGNCTVTMDAAKTVTATFDGTAPAQGSSTLPKTGQTTCYDATGTAIACAGTGQDGAVQAGIAWPSSRFANNGNGTVTDHLTGLVWLKDAGCTGFGPFVPWTDALTKANNLATGQCGLTDGSQAGDWRLPNINELRSLLMTAGQSDMTVWLTGQGFSNAGSSYWSSTPANSDGSAAWAIDLSSLYIYGVGATPGTRVWPVRDGQDGGVIILPKTGQTTSAATGDDGALQKGAAWPSPRFTDNNDGTVTDHLTSLVWLKKGTCAVQTKTWSDALTYAVGMAEGQCDLADGSKAGDWRLPNVNELQSVIDWSKSGPALPAGHPFTEVAWNRYWTSTSIENLPGSAWQVNLNNGGAFPANKSYELSNAYAWPVRTGQETAVNRTLTVAKAGTGAGTVTSAPAGIDCGANCSAAFAAGAQVTLTATPATGSTFAGWSGGGCSGTGICTVTLGSDAAITATFLLALPTVANAGPGKVVFDKALLDASASQGNIVSYQWTLTHHTNAAYNRTATGQKPNIADLQPGFYDVLLTVTDAASQTQTAATLLAVAGPWDINADGKQGLAEIIYLLQLLTGMKP
ncbi:MAG: DUF1566 domain-containing protein [Syntrophales bacterium]|jgi:hypothetical protein|nr:DUF1566 domain-containing protein [Syntrophales bacterium]